MPNLPPRDRRTQPDRRARQTSPLTISSLFGSRTRYRRKDDQRRYYYIDRYSLTSILVVLVTILLSVTDAIFTLKLVSRGAYEANPVMAFFLRFGPVPFIVAKYLLTGASLLWFLVHKNYAVMGGPIRVRHILGAVLVMYLVLICYEIYLFAVIG